MSGTRTGLRSASSCTTGSANSLTATTRRRSSPSILTIFIMSINGIVIGAIMEIVHKDHTPLFVAAALLPHGIFEIPAFIISGALGILLAQSLIAEWYGGGDSAIAAYSQARLFLAVVLPLVVIAACVEAFITPVVIHLVA